MTSAALCAGLSMWGPTPRVPSGRGACRTGRPPLVVGCRSYRIMPQPQATHYPLPCPNLPCIGYSLYPLMPRAELPSPGYSLRSKAGSSPPHMADWTRDHEFASTPLRPATSPADSPLGVVTFTGKGQTQRGGGGPGAWQSSPTQGIPKARKRSLSKKKGEYTLHPCSIWGT